MRLGQFIWIQVLFFVVKYLYISYAAPNPVLDNESDSSNEIRRYAYPDFVTGKDPYWSAFPKQYLFKMKEHDRLELNVLRSTRQLDFKLREAWTRSDKPFDASK